MWRREWWKGIHPEAIRKAGECRVVQAMCWRYRWKEVSKFKGHKKIELGGADIVSRKRKVEIKDEPFISDLASG